MKPPRPELFAVLGMPCLVDVHHRLPRQGGLQFRMANDYPEYFPEKPGVKEAAAEFLNMGAWPMVYINGHLWDSDTPSYAERGGEKAACKKWDGSLYFEHWSKQNHSLPDPSHALRHEVMMELAEKIFGDLGMKGLYLDQIGAVPAYLDFDPEHAHPKGGGSWWVEGYDKLLTSLQRRIAEIDPDNILTTEDNAEPYIRGLDGMLMCNNAPPDGLPMYAVVYNDYMALGAGDENLTTSPSPPSGRACSAPRTAGSGWSW